MDAGAGGSDFVHTPEPVCASSQVCVAGVALRVSFSVRIVAFGGLSTCETGYDSVCVLELCVSLGGGHGCGGVWDDPLSPGSQESGKIFQSISVMN